MAEILTTLVERFLIIWLVVFGFFMVMIMLIGVGAGGIFASSLEHTRFEDLFRDGCLELLLGSLFSSFIMALVFFLLSLCILGVR
ncbi:MAG: hypothetical protein QXP01_07360 [Candidatus Hadarchaeum sp.]